MSSEIKYLGSYAEHYVISKLLSLNVEAYLAIKTNQKDYDITVILNSSYIKRIQVKATDLNNKSTNNSITGTNKNYDFLILIIVDNEKTKEFILTKSEVVSEQGNAKQLGCSKQESGKFIIRDSLIKFENQWKKITTTTTTQSDAQ